jgi:hypothetical protein
MRGMKPALGRHGGKVLMSSYVPRELYEALRRAAAKDQRSLSSLLRVWVRERLVAEGELAASDGEAA